MATHVTRRSEPLASASLADTAESALTERHFVTAFEAVGFPASGFHHTRAITAEYAGKTGRLHEWVSPQLPVDAAYGCCPDADQNVCRSNQLRFRHLSQA